MNGCYAMLCQNTTYPSLAKALKEQYHSKSYLMTVDKPVTWNQEIVAHDFGIDNMNVEKTGNVADKEIKRQTEAHRVSDLLIRYDKVVKH